MEGGTEYGCNKKTYWTPLTNRLNAELQEDIYRIYKDSLFCDWIVKFNDRTLEINRCIVIARAYKFYNFLVNVVNSDSGPNKLQIDCVCRFLTKIYRNCDIEEEEKSVLNELKSLEKLPSSDSEGFITADSSPTDIKNGFYDTPVLEQELKEQDQLSLLFKSIKSKSKIPRYVKSVRNPVLKNLNSSEMDSGLETASSDLSGMDLEQLSNKERRIVNEHDSSSSETTEDFEDLGKNTKYDLATQTKEQKQKQNEEIVIMESSSVSSETGSWESVFPRNKQTSDQKTVNTSNGNHYFIDASSLHDENEFSSSSTALVVGTKSSKLTKVKVNDLSDSQKYETAEFQKEIKVFETQNMDSGFFFVNECPSTSSNIPSDNLKASNEDIECKSDDDSSDDISKNLAEPLLKSQNKYLPDIEENNFIRSNTFEIEPDDIERRNNERRLGSVIFQNSIQQYSGHVIEEIPVTPHNSIIQLTENVIIDSENPLQSLFYDKKDSEEVETDLKPIKREDSVPIISGGVSSTDFKPEVRIDSPLSKRKLESTPIVSGGAVLDDPPLVEKLIKPTVTAAWVVDMKPDDVAMQQEEQKNETTKEKQKTSLGFYVDLSQITTEVEPKQTIEPENGENDKKNIFSMFIDFEAPKKSMPSRLSQSLHSKKATSKTDTPLSQSITNLEGETSNITNGESSKPKTDTQFSQSTTNIEGEISNITNGESSNSKSVYMFIDSETTVVKRRRSSSNNRSHNRHSWNSSGESDTSTLCHQRTYSLSGHDSLETRPIIPEKKLVESSSSSDKDTSSVDDKKMLPIAETKESFVRLSDLDKPTPKIITAEPEPARMTRSIPETSWIENKLLLSRSTGCRTSSSRLLSTSTPSNLFLTHRSKSPGQDTDEMVSELSDLSSMHSSTALEVSTEETSQSSSYQPQRSADRLGHDLLRMFLEEISPDVTVEVSGRRLKAHKCILSSRCQYFAAMLSGGWVESAGNVISLQGFSYQAVHFAMCHIYSGAADIPESISLVELATLADMLGLEGLKEVVAYTLKLKHCHLFHKPCSVCVVGVLECLPLAAAYGLDELYRKALRWITRYFVRVWPTRAFAMLPRELMEKCYQQHVVHMSADNVLETTLCCDKLLATLPSVRWAEVVHELTSQLAEACQVYVTQHFSSVLASASFLSLGKELSWNISRLEDGLFRASERLQPEQACRSYARAHRLLALLESGEDCWSPNFVDLSRKLLSKVEDTVVRQAVRVSYTSAWPRLDTNLRNRIQELCCLPLDRPRTARQPRSTSGSRNLDLRQVRLAMQQHTRRAQSNDSRPAAKPQKPPPKPVTDPPRPRTWPAQNKKIISSSESSRTSSPAMKRAVNKNIKQTKDDMSLDSLASPKIEVKTKPKIDLTKKTLPQTKKPNNILKSNIQKKPEKPNLSKSLPSMNKENRTITKQSSSSTQHSPSALLRNKTNTSSPQSQPAPYNSSPSLRRSLLLAARAPQTPVKPVSPATNKRLARVQSASHSVTSPTKSSAAKCVNTRKTVPQRQVTKPAGKKSETVEKVGKTKVERSGTFLKDEPTVLNKNK